MSVSPQEKEKLRKRLQKLFEKENLRKSGNGTFKKQHEDQIPMDELRNYGNNKKQQQKKPKSCKLATMQNGLAKASVKQDSKSRNKCKDSSLKKDKTKLLKKTNATATEADEGVPSNNNLTKISSTQKRKGDKFSAKHTKNKNFVKKKQETPKVDSRENKNDTKFKTANQQKNGASNICTKAKKRAASSNKMDSKTVANKKQRLSSNNIREDIKTQKKPKIIIDESDSSFSQNEMGCVPGGKFDSSNNESHNENATTAKRRAASTNNMVCTTVSNKKQIFSKKNIREDIKTQKKPKIIIDESDSQSSQNENDYDINHMMGCVPGGEFDCSSDDDDDHYWMKDENHSYNSDEDSTENDSDSDDEVIENQNEVFSESDDISNKTCEENTAMKRFKKQPKTDIKHLNNYQNNSDSEEEGSSESDEFETEYSDSDSSEESYEHYSDYDEDDYEEEQDSYEYTSDSNNEYCSDYDEFTNGMSYDYYHDDTDMDYELPKHIPEDLIIHKGTSSKRDLKLEDNICFDSDNEELQIIELEKQEQVNIISQPKAYDKEELVKLKHEKKTLSSVKLQKKESIPKDKDCPKLVPIVSEDGFQLYNPNQESDDDEEVMNDMEEEMDEFSLGSEFTEIESDDADSLLSEDITEKYLKSNNYNSDSDDYIDQNIWLEKHKPDIIDATGYKYENTLLNANNSSEVSSNDDIVQMPTVKFYENVDSKTECNVLSASIIDSDLLFKSDNSARSLSTKITEEENENQVSSTQMDECENSTDKSKRAIKSQFFNAFNSNLVIVLLKDPFYIYGTVRLSLLAGSMEVYGHRLKLNTEVEIFSPRGCSVIEISSLPTKNHLSKETLKELLQLQQQHFSLNDLEIIVSLYNAETDAIVLLKRNDERKKVVQQYKKFMNENVFPNINNINTDRPLYNSEYLLRCMINTSVQDQKCLRIPENWQEFKLTSQSRVMLAGGKSVGKSTLLRYLINRHLPQKILLIDLDIGQPEVFVPQTVSCTIIEQPLLGPGFLLNLQPEISFAVGHVNIAMCAHKYLSAVRSLLAYCREQEAFKDIPWLFNTMGYNKGFGLELISILVQEPLTDIIQLHSSKEINNFETTLQAHVLSKVPRVLFLEEYESIKEQAKENCNYRLHVWPSAVQQESRYQKEWEMSSKDFRFAMLLARLSEALHGHADWLTDVKPLSASLNDLKIVNLLDNTPLVSAEELEKSLEANLVYLCHYEDDLKPLKCLGIGVVRAVDFHVRHLYLIPALPHTQLKDVNCLAIGEMPLPTSLFTNQGPRVKNITPFVYNTVDASASKAIKQLYHRPAKFLTGKRKSLD